MPDSIFICSEGETEYLALPEIAKQIMERSSSRLVAAPTKLNCAPDAPVDKVARALKTSLVIARAKGASTLVVLLDREQIKPSAGSRAKELQRAIEEEHGNGFQYRVVIKDRTFENWLIADPGAFKKQKARFKITKALESQVVPDKADRVPADRWLDSAVVGKSSYEKKRDATNTVKHFSVARAAKNSRSFRHFCHVLGYEDYAEQCKRP